MKYYYLVTPFAVKYRGRCVWYVVQLPKYLDKKVLIELVKKIYSKYPNFLGILYNRETGEAVLYFAKVHSYQFGEITIPLLLLLGGLLGGTILGTQLVKSGEGTWVVNRPPLPLPSFWDILKIGMIMFIVAFGLKIVSDFIQSLKEHKPMPSPYEYAKPIVEEAKQVVVPAVQKAIPYVGKAVSYIARKIK